MKLLLTSAGVKNSSINQALVQLLGKPIAECDALAIPTASYGHPMSGPGRAYSFISGFESVCPMTEIGWKSLGVLELTALPSIDTDRWVGWVRAADALVVNGGDALYLAHWLRESGLADLLGSLPNMVWLGMSGGSMALTPRIGKPFVQWQPPGGGDRALGLVDFSIFPHLDNPGLPENTLPNAQRWADGLTNPAYAIDDQTAIRVVDGVVDVISEGHWTTLTPSPDATDSASPEVTGS